MFYKIDTTRLTVREYFRTTPIFTLPLFLLLKLFRVRLYWPGAIPESLEPFRVEREEIPEEVLEKITPLEEEMRLCGFVEPVYHWVNDPFGARKLFLATYRHSTGLAFGEILQLQYNVRSKPREKLEVSFATPYQDGTSFVSTSGRREFLRPPWRKVQHLVGMPTPELWKSHNNQHILKSFGKAILKLNSQEELLNYAYAEMARTVVFHIGRGVYVPHDEANRLPGDPASPLTDADRTFAAVYAKIGQFLGRVADWKSVFFTIVVSLVIYFAVGRGERGGQAVAMILGVLFFHECGHLAAMWIFRYRNLRMFFIPWLGAAVSGQTYNVPGWKKAVVALMGPLPGIALGAGLGIAASINNWPAMQTAAYMLLGFNAFNLLPVLPLDGGKAMQSVLFSRHPAIDVALRAIAGAALLLSGVFSKGLAIVGGTMLFGLPMTYRIGLIVQRLRGSGFGADSPDGLTIPRETARAIHDELRPVLPGNAAVNILARWNLNVFESLNAKPPGIPASIALIGVHLGGILAAAVLLVALVINQFGGLKEMATRMIFGMGEPKHAVQCKEVLAWEGAEAPKTAHAKANTIVADFPTRQAAEESYRDVTAKLPPRATAVLFGQTMFVTLPADDDKARERWFDELSGGGRNVFVQRDDEPACFSLTCIAPDEKTAEKLAEEANMYFEMPPGMHLIPPWSPEPLLADRDLKARRTYQAIRDQSRNCLDPRWDSLNTKSLKAMQRGDKQALDKIGLERRQLAQTIIQEHIREMRNEGPEKWDLPLLDLYEKWPAPIAMSSMDFVGGDPNDRAAYEKRQKEQESWEFAFAAHLGQLPLEGDAPALGANRFSGSTGNIFPLDRTLRVNVWLLRSSAGAPAILKWLSEHGCTEVKYEFGTEMNDGLFGEIPDL